MKLFAALLFACLPSFAMSQGLTPEQLRAQLDERSSSNSAFRDMLNDPDPARSRAAMELMIESNEPQLVRLAIDHGLLSATPEVRAYALRAFLDTRPTLLVQVTLPDDVPEKFEGHFRHVTDGTILSNGTATYRLNVGMFHAEKNCYLETGHDWCGIAITPDGVAMSTRAHGNSGRWTYTNLTFQDSGQLAGSTTVWDVPGGFTTSLTLTP